MQSGEPLGQDIKSRAGLGSDAPRFEEDVIHMGESPAYMASGSLSNSSGSPPGDHNEDSSEVRAAMQRD